MNSRNRKLFFVKALLSGFIILFSVFFIHTYSQVSSLSSKIDIAWEALDAYSRPLYEGRCLPGEEALIKAIALVEIKTPAGNLDSKKLFYAWTYNDYYIYNYSKTGGGVIYFTLDSLKNKNILKLQIYTNNTKDTLIGEKSITIVPRQLIPVVYRNNENPILMYANALNKKYESYRVEIGETINMRAEPFNISAKNTLDTNIDYVWSVNKIPNNGDENNEFVYTINNKREQSIGIKITNNDKLLQEVETLVQFKY